MRPIVFMFRFTFSADKRCLALKWALNHIYVIPDFAPSDKAECRFPPDYLDTWLLFGDHSREKIVVESGRFKSSSLGTFICKSKHWELDYYKVFSIGSKGW
ncbi:hypothetical protein LSAT2_024415 [Lamellibrachia satsuma]|nr:hypothetical protein LSAT2_024415 [Lamellibrachia satsuma]